MGNPPGYYGRVNPKLFEMIPEMRSSFSTREKVWLRWQSCHHSTA